jgi:hypothetical protein
VSTYLLNIKPSFCTVYEATPEWFIVTWCTVRRPQHLSMLITCKENTRTTLDSCFRLTAYFWACLGHILSGGPTIGDNRSPAGPLFKSYALPNALCLKFKHAAAVTPRSNVTIEHLHKFDRVVTGFMPHCWKAPSHSAWLSLSGHYPTTYLWLTELLLRQSNIVNFESFRANWPSFPFCQLLMPYSRTSSRTEHLDNVERWLRQIILNRCESGRSSVETFR